MSDDTIWLNGVIRAAEAAISAHDRGFLLGESVFESVLVRDAKPQFWQAHIDRLWRACAYFDFACPYTPQDLASSAQTLIAQWREKNPPSLERAVLRITVTGGDGGRGLVPSAHLQPQARVMPQAQANWLMQVSAVPLARPAITRLMVSDVIRLAEYTANQHKRGAYSDNIIARKAAMAAGADEAILLNQFGRVACAAAATIFIGSFTEDVVQLYTPPLREGALDAIIRRVLLDADMAQISITERALAQDDLQNAPIILLSNSIMEVVVAQFNSAASEQTKKLAVTLNEYLHQMGAR